MIKYNPYFSYASLERGGGGETRTEGQCVYTKMESIHFTIPCNPGSTENNTCKVIRPVLLKALLVLKME